jgi:hypothetical protein
MPISYLQQNMFNSLLQEGKGREGRGGRGKEKGLTYSIYQFYWSKYSHHGNFKLPMSHQPVCKNNSCELE